MEININSSDFYYQEISEPLTDQVLDLIKSNCKEFFDYFSWVYNHPIDNEGRPVGFKLKVVRSESQILRGYDIWGSAGFDECAELSIWITIVIPPRVWQKNIVIDRAELLGTISHELHHIAQSLQNLDLENKESGKLKYFLDPCEIEAFHIGVRAQSKLSGIAFSSLAKKYLTLAAPGLERQCIDRVVDAWRTTEFPLFQNVAGRC